MLVFAALFFGAGVGVATVGSAATAFLAIGLAAVAGAGFSVATVLAFSTG